MAAEPSNFAEDTNLPTETERFVQSEILNFDTNSAGPVDAEMQNDLQCVLQPDELKAQLSRACAPATQNGFPILDTSQMVPVLDEQDDHRPAAVANANTETANVEPPTAGIVLNPARFEEFMAAQATNPSDNHNNPEDDFHRELVEFAGQISPINTVPPAAAGGQDEQLCNRAKRAILYYHGASIISEYLQGKYLSLLQKERAKPGTGTFIADLAELRKVGALVLSTPTAYRRIWNYELVNDGLVDLLPYSLSQADIDKWGGIECVTVQNFEEALERDAGDERAKKFLAMIEEEKRRLAKLKREQGGSTTLNVQFFGLAKDDKKRFRDAFGKLVQANGNDKVAASKFLVEIVCFVAQTGKAVTA